MAFWDNIHFPYFNMQELNLDWIMKELKRIAGFMPQDGNVGDILTRKSDGAAWEPPEAVNININGLPEDTEIGDNDQLIFYDISAQANRKIKPPNLLDSMMSNGTPLMDGTGSAGTSKKPARYDHRHPTDTSRQAALSGAQIAAVNSGAAANSFTNGILDILHGGTGASSAGAGLRNLDFSTQYIGDGNSYLGTDNSLDTAVFVFGKRGANAILSIVFTNLGNASVIDLAGSGYITASIVDNKLKITTDPYVHARCISIVSSIYFTRV